MKPKVYMVFCEGKSECNYLQALNRFSKDNDLGIVFIFYDLKGISKGKINKSIPRKIQQELKKDNQEFYLWIDYDIFKREDEKEQDLKKELIDNIQRGIHKNYLYTISEKNILLNFMDFEDFYILHFEEEKIKKWQEFCNNNNYNNSESKLQDFKTIFKEYKKGTPPEITKGSLKKVIENINNKQISFKSDIKKVLQILLDKLD